MFIVWLPLQSQETDKDKYEHVKWQFHTNQPLLLESAERPLTEDKIPAKALQTLRAVAGSHKLVAFEEELRNGQKFYEGEWKTPQGMEDEATVTAGGVLAETENEILAKDVPAVVRKAANKLSRGQPVSFARRQFIYYEIGYVQDGQEHEVLLNPLGEKIGSELSVKADSGDDVD